MDPGQFIEIKLSLSAHYIPSVYEGEVECVIFWDPNEGKNPEKETLFLRIKKKSILTVIYFFNKYIYKNRIKYNQYQMNITPMKMIQINMLLKFYCLKLLLIF